MKVSLDTVVAATLLPSIVLPLVARAVRKVPASTIDNLHLFLCPVDLELIGSLLSPSTEASMRMRLSTDGFRKGQRLRILGAFEQVSRMSRNVAAIYNCMKTESARLRDTNPDCFDERQTLIVQAMEEATQIDRCLKLLQIRIFFWIAFRIDAWRFLPSPSLSDLRHSLGTEIVGAYADFRGSIGKLTLTYGNDRHEQIMAAL